MTSSTKAATTAVVDAAVVGSYGKILVSSSGRTLYRYTPDGTGPPTCTGACATTWPPLTVPTGTAAVAAGPAVVATDLGTVARSGGALQVTYKKMPLYTYSGDTAAGQANGQGIGGIWYVIPVATTTTPVTAANATTTTTAAGY